MRILVPSSSPYKEMYSLGYVGNKNRVKNDRKILIEFHYDEYFISTITKLEFHKYISSIVFYPFFIYIPCWYFWAIIDRAEIVVIYFISFSGIFSHSYTKQICAVKSEHRYIGVSLNA